MDLSAQLSKTESEIARLLAIGKSSKEVADIRCISEVTVQNHRANIYRKAEVQKATELCIWWFCRTFGIKLEQVMALGLLVVFCVYEYKETSQDLTRSRRQEQREMRSRIKADETEYEW